MREILFKAKRLDNGEWVEGHLVKRPSCIQFCLDSYSSWYVNRPAADPDDNSSEYNIDPETIGQYTGLKDKSGRRIFEGDILRNHGNPVDLTLVKFGEFGVIDVEAESVVDNAIGWHTKVIPTDALSQCEPFCYNMPLSDYWLKRYEAEVIGNIHDNPELLKGGATG